MKKILIVYISKTGSTKDTVLYIEKKLKERKLEAEIKTVNEVFNLEDYSKVILGAPINGMKIIPEMKEFITNNKNKLSEIPCCFFVLSYIHNNGRKFFRNAIEKDINATVAGLNIKTSIIGGKINKPMPKLVNLLFGTSSSEPLDNRDFGKVDELLREI